MNQKEEPKLKLNQQCLTCKNKSWCPPSMQVVMEGTNCEEYQGENDEML